MRARRGDLAPYPNQATLLTTKGFSLYRGRFRRGRSLGRSRKSRGKRRVRWDSSANTAPTTIAQTSYRSYHPNVARKVLRSGALREKACDEFQNKHLKGAYCRNLCYRLLDLCYDLMYHCSSYQTSSSLVSLPDTHKVNWHV